MKKNKEFLVLLDAGHGENTPGKRSPDGKFREYLFAREIAEDLSRELTRDGLIVKSVVRGVIDTPLSERVRIVNAYCKEYGVSNVVLVSIHCNAAGDGKEWLNGRGFEVYTSPGNTKSDMLAECIYKAAEICLPDMKMRYDLNDGDYDKEARFAMLTQTKCPAVLTENLFQDNREDVAFLMSPAGKRAIVNLHLQGILNYIVKTKKQCV